MISRYKLAVKIEEQLREQSLRQKDLAERSGIASATISRYIHMQQNATAPNIKRIADALGVSCEYLGMVNEEYFVNPFKEFVVDRSKKKGIKLTDLSRNCGRSYSQIHNYLNLRQTISLDAFMRMCNTLDVEPGELYHIYLQAKGEDE